MYNMLSETVGLDSVLRQNKKDIFWYQLRLEPFGLKCCRATHIHLYHSAFRHECLVVFSATGSTRVLFRFGTLVAMLHIRLHCSCACTKKLSLFLPPAALGFFSGLKCCRTARLRSHCSAFRHESMLLSSATGSSRILSPCGNSYASQAVTSVVIGLDSIF